VNRDPAATSSIFFDGSRLTLARQLAGLRKSELAARLGKSPTAVAAWEAGTKRPTPANVAQLALGLSVDPGFFTARSNSVASISGVPHFRSLRSTTQIARDQAFAYGQMAVDVAVGLERHVEFPAVDIPLVPVEAVDAMDDAPEQAARHLREAWGVGHGPIRNVVRELENHGIVVVFSPLQTATVDAYSFYTQLRPIVVLNPIRKDYYRQRFDVAHELGHLVMHGDAEPGSRTIEDQAHRFAAELLMPTNEIEPLLPAAMNRAAWVTLAKLKEQWGVSLQALLFRARRLGRLSDASYRNAMVTLTSRGWRRDEPGIVNVLEQPSLLPQAVDLLAQVGINKADLVDECRIPTSLFRTIVARTPMQASHLEADQEHRARQTLSLLEGGLGGSEQSALNHRSPSG